MPRCYVNPSTIFQPGATLLATIAQAVQPAVTTTTAHKYKSGLIVRFDIPQACGMQQLDGMTSRILVTGAMAFTAVDIDSSSFAPFNAHPFADNMYPSVNICSQCVPVGETALPFPTATDAILQSSTVNVLPFNP